jgi:transposase-like protein
MQYITKLVLSQDDYHNLLEALQLFIKSPKVTEENFDELRNLYGHIKQQYGRREKATNLTSASEVMEEEKTSTPTPAPVSKKVGVKSSKAVEKTVEDNGVEAHPFIASKKQSWICTECGKSRNSSYHKNAEGKLWLPKKG